MTNSDSAPPSYVEMYNAERDRWDCFPVDQPYQVQADETLLYRVLPNGINGPRLDDCPRLNAYVLLHQHLLIGIGYLPARYSGLQEHLCGYSASIILRRFVALPQQGRGCSAFLALTVQARPMAKQNESHQRPNFISPGLHLGHQIEIAMPCRRLGQCWMSTTSCSCVLAQVLELG